MSTRSNLTDLQQIVRELRHLRTAVETLSASVLFAGIAQRTDKSFERIAGLAHDAVEALHEERDEREGRQ
jgi:hypothetical protein